MAVRRIIISAFLLLSLALVATCEVVQLKGGDVKLFNSKAWFVVSHPSHRLSYAKSGGNIVGAGIAGDQNNLVLLVFTYFKWPNQAIYKEIEIVDSWTVRVRGFVLRNPEITVETTYRLAPNLPCLIIESSLFNTGKKTVKLPLGDTIRTRRGSIFVPGRGFDLGRCETEFLAGISERGTVLYMPLEVDVQTGKLRTLKVPSIYPNCVVKEAEVPPGGSVCYRRALVVERDFARAVEFYYRLAGISYMEICGMVYDGESGAPVEGASVFVYSPGRARRNVLFATETDPTGFWKAVVPKGRKLEVMISKDGYALFVKSIGMSVSFLKVPLSRELGAVAIKWGPYITLKGSTVSVHVRTNVETRAVMRVKPPSGTEMVIASVEPKLLHILSFSATQDGRYIYKVMVSNPLFGSVKTSTEEVLINRKVPFSFVVYGDTRTFPDRHALVAKAISKEKGVSFVVHVGDHVETGAVEQEWDDYFAAVRSFSCHEPIFPVLGNHEGYADIYFDAFGFPENYWFRWGNSLFVVLDSNVWLENLDEEELNEETRWLEEVLEANEDAKFKFVFFHHPLVSSDVYYKGSKKLRDLWLPIFIKHGVDAVFSGHVHAYEHYVIDGIHLFVTGGGGAPLYHLSEGKPEGFIKGVECVLHYVRVDVGKDQVTITVKAVGKGPAGMEEGEVVPLREVLEEVVIKK